MYIREIVEQISAKRLWLQGKTIGLIGPLGAGKTFFVKTLLEKWEPDLVNQVSSPSFTVCNIYTTENLTVRHFDFYRLKSPEELEEIGFYEYIDEPEGINIIEWVDIFEETVSLCDLIIHIQIDADGNHIYTI